jgi:hypothetical protein
VLTKVVCGCQSSSPKFLYVPPIFKVFLLLAHISNVGVFAIEKVENGECNHRRLFSGPRLFFVAGQLNSDKTRFNMQELLNSEESKKDSITRRYSQSIFTTQINAAGTAKPLSQDRGRSKTRREEDVQDSRNSKSAQRVPRRETNKGIPEMFAEEIEMCCGNCLGARQRSLEARSPRYAEVSGSLGLAIGADYAHNQMASVFFHVII